MSGDTKNELLTKACACCQSSFSSEHSVCPNDGTTLTVLKTDDLVGTLFADRYEILSLAGSGGMGHVYKARHRYMNRIVAVKVIRTASVANVDTLKRFLVEVQAASALSMPNIVGVHDSGVAADGQPYLVMDYIEGPSLEDYVESRGAIGADRAIDIFLQIARALQQAHSRGIIHRDIKRSNIILTNAEGQPDFVKVVDFGIAKFVDQVGAEAVALTKTGEVFGSPLYMSPEQWRGERADARTDLYALGAVMYMTLTGQPLFDSNQVLQIAYKHAHERPPSFASQGVRIEPVLESIVFKALEKNPDDRFQSAQELVDALVLCKQGLGAVIQPSVDQSVADLEKTVVSGSAAGGHDSTNATKTIVISTAGAGTNSGASGDDAGVTVVTDKNVDGINQSHSNASSDINNITTTHILLPRSGLKVALIAFGSVAVAGGLLFAGTQLHGTDKLRKGDTSEISPSMAEPNPQTDSRGKSNNRVGASPSLESRPSIQPLPQHVEPASIAVPAVTTPQIQPAVQPPVKPAASVPPVIAPSVVAPSTPHLPATQPSAIDSTGATSAGSRVTEPVATPAGSKHTSKSRSHARTSTPSGDKKKHGISLTKAFKKFLRKF